MRQGWAGLNLRAAVQGALRICCHVRESAVGLGEFIGRARYQNYVTSDLLAKIVETISARPHDFRRGPGNGPGPLCCLTRHRALRVADPLAPGAGVETCALESGHLHAPAGCGRRSRPSRTSQIAASGGTPSRVVREPLAQRAASEKSPGGVHVVGERMIARARDVARHGVDRLVARRRNGRRCGHRPTRRPRAANCREAMSSSSSASCSRPCPSPAAARSAGPAARAAPETRAASFRPAAAPPARPRSRHRVPPTRVCPSQRSSHQSRAA